MKEKVYKDILIILLIIACVIIGIILIGDTISRIKDNFVKINESCYEVITFSGKVVKCRTIIIDGGNAGAIGCEDGWEYRNIQAFKKCVK